MYRQLAGIERWLSCDHFGCGRRRGGRPRRGFVGRQFERAEIGEAQRAARGDRDD